MSLETPAQPAASQTPEDSPGGQPPARSRLRGLLRTALVTLVLLLALPGLLVLWLVLAPDRDPERFAYLPLPSVVAQHSEPYAGEGCPSGSQCRDVTLELTRQAPIRFTVSLPEASEAEGLPVVVLFGGFRTGREAMKHLPELGRNAVITYEYPVDRARWKEASALERLWLMERASRATPRQLATLAAWTATQAWADPSRVTLVGVSLGALLLPAAQRLAQSSGHWLGSSALVYGGAETRRLVLANLEIEPDWLRRAAAELATIIARPIEPGEHLPHLQGAFLLINGRHDKRVPIESAQRLHELAPEPKQVVVLESGHIDPNDTALLAEILTVAGDWLRARGAVNP